MELHALASNKVKKLADEFKKQLELHSNYVEYANMELLNVDKTNHNNSEAIVYTIEAGGEGESKEYRVAVTAGSNIMEDKVGVALYRDGVALTPNTTNYVTDLLEFDDDFIRGVVQDLVDEININYIG